MCARGIKNKNKKKSEILVKGRGASKPANEG